MSNLASCLRNRANGQEALVSWASWRHRQRRLTRLTSKSLFLYILLLPHVFSFFSYFDFRENANSDVKASDALKTGTFLLTES